jgi:receptor expression-enhancing protein 5/6
MSGMLGVVMDELTKIDSFVEQNVISKNATVADFHKKHPEVRPSYVVLGLVSFLLLFILFGAGVNALSNLVGFVYPLYASFKALKTETKTDDAQWLTYWVVYGFFQLVESLTDILVYWIPFYYLFKILFFVFLFHPTYRGAEVIFSNVIDPFFSKHLAPKIDHAAETLKKTAEEVKETIAAGKQD